MYTDTIVNDLVKDTQSAVRDVFSRLPELRL